MNRIFGTVLAGAVLAAGMTTAAFGDEKEGVIQKRKENQQARIAQGVKSGQLTPHETAKIERKEAALNHEIRSERRANGGNLTNKQKAQVNRQQNQLSREIAHEKHDAQSVKK